MTAFVWVENPITAEQSHYAHRASPMKGAQHYDRACEYLTEGSFAGFCEE